MQAQFEFLDFIPESELRSFANQILRDVLELAPSDSIAYATLQKEGKVYSCSLDIYSSREIFHIRVKENDPDKAIQEMEKILLEKIIARRKQRIEEIRLAA